jgi:hypothetical protein
VPALLLLLAVVLLLLLLCPNCQVRYPQLPQQQRILKAVWRGSNTDSNVTDVDDNNILDVLRSRLHLFGRWYPDIIDAHYTSFVHYHDIKCAQKLLQLGMARIHDAEAAVAVWVYS